MGSRCFSLTTASVGTLPRSGGGPGTMVGHEANSHEDKVNTEEGKGKLGSVIMSNQE